MRKTTLLLGLAFVASTLTGCDDDVTKVCKKTAELMEKEKDIPEEAKKEMADIEKCKAKAEEEKKKDPEKFKKGADCVLGASDMDGAMKCMMEADSKDKKEEEKKE